MKRIHPNASHFGVLAALAVLLGVAGCRSPSGGLANPFLAPDRVPPPATRAILPGQAQPYYPGDPLPVMQSQVAPTVDSRGLAWSAPNSGAPAAPQSPQPTTVPNRSVAREGMVAIPADSDSLRFSLPPAVEPEPNTPVEPTPANVASIAENPDVQQAAYTEPVMESREPPASPWRSPQIAQAALPPPPMVQTMLPQPVTGQPLASQPMTAMPVAGAQNMDVRLRAVASPPPEPLPGSSPRIRMPGEVVPQTASFDGFRPRSSMR
jgi:hypothetical protein